MQQFLLFLGRLIVELADRYTASQEPEPRPPRLPSLGRLVLVWELWDDGAGGQVYNRTPAIITDIVSEDRAAEPINPDSPIMVTMFPYAVNPLPIANPIPHGPGGKGKQLTWGWPDEIPEPNL